MGKKKFIEKKKSATFQLLARDSSSYSSDPPAVEGGGPPITDRVFVRVDNNPYSTQAFLEDDDQDGDDSDSIFADALGDADADEDGDDVPSWIGGGSPRVRAAGPLQDHVRKEILELGLPDDGYNYLLHMREIRNSGGGSSYYHNSKAKLDQVPLDVKAYDASRLRVSSDVGGEPNRESIYSVASKTVGVKVQKAVDPDVVRLLDDSDLSRFGSDVEDLEEDFVVRANLPEEGEEVEVFRGVEEKTEVKSEVGLVRDTSLSQQEEESILGEDEDELGGEEKPRVRRLLDEQFDLLTLREYDNDSDSDDAGFVDTEGESLAANLNHALKDYTMDDLEQQEKYRVPGDFVDGHQGTCGGTQQDFSAVVIRKCVEYAEMYCDESQDNDEVAVFEESSDESEIWDCETIVSTYSNLDNHPGKIQAPANPWKKLPENHPGDSNAKSNVITLRGKEKLPVEFLPHNRRIVEKVKRAVNSEVDKQKRKPNSEESKEEKKERKAAVKEERREARRAKKELKGLYRCETQRAQKVAAVSGPSSIHLM